MFVRKAEAYLSDILLGRLQTLPTNIILAWKGFPLQFIANILKLRPLKVL